MPCMKISDDIIHGPTVYLRLVGIADAAEIVRLRTDPRCEGKISATASDTAAQEAWLSSYFDRFAAGRELYYVACRRDTHEIVGTIRAYDIALPDYRWGSWVTSPTAPQNAAIEAFLLCMDYMLYVRGATRCFFEVRQGNHSSIRFHQRMGAKLASEDASELRLTYTREDYAKYRPRFAKILPPFPAPGEGVK